MKSIVIPTDFSENALQAIDFAVHKLGDDDAEFLLLHVYQIPQGGQSGLFYLLEEMQKQAQKDMEDLLKTLSKRYSNKKPTFKTKVLQGDLADQCNAIAKDLKANCIVMGTKGASGIKEMLLGSNTVKLMNSLSKPLYAVPEEHQYSGIEEVVLAYDGKPMQESYAEAAKYYAKKHSLPLEIVHVRIDDENPLQNWDQINPLFKDVELSVRESQAEDFEEGLKKVSEGKNALIAMIRHKQTFWERLFNRSDSRKALMHSKLPVLVIPEDQ